MQKAHDASKNNWWRNFPNIDTPITQDQLNRNETTVDVIDDRVIVLDSSKANQTDMLQAVRSIGYTAATGTFRVTFFNGTYIDIDTDIEKIAINFDYDDDPTSPTYQQIIITLEDGTKKYIDISALVTEYDFVTSDTIQPQINNGQVRMNVINGSITGEKLQPNYLADITTQAQAAAQSATASANSSILSQSWAEGDTGAREDEDTRNSKYYADLAAETVAELLAAFGISVVGERLIFGATFEDQYDIEVSGTSLIISERS